MNNKEKEIRRKEVAWFVRKYLSDDENLKLFTSQLCPFDCAKIMKIMFELGLSFTWSEEDLPEEVKQQFATRSKE